jgi:hypothetical protein
MDAKETTSGFGKNPRPPKVKKKKRTNVNYFK